MPAPPAATARPSDQQASRSCRVVLVDTEPVFVEGLRGLCVREGFVVVGSGTVGEDAVRLAREFRPDVAVLALVMPGLNGVEATRQIAEVSPETRVLLVAAMLDERRLADAWQGGAWEIALRSQPSDELAHATREVAAGRRYVCPGDSVEHSGVYRSSDTGYPNQVTLTRRERQVLQLIADGMTIVEIATFLRIAPKTAAYHREHIRKKLGARTTAHLVRWAIRSGLVLP